VLVRVAGHVPSRVDRRRRSFVAVVPAVASVLVVVTVVAGVPVTVMQVIDVITVTDLVVSAARCVGVTVPGDLDVLIEFALVVMSAMRVVAVPVVQIVDMVPVRHGGMAAVLPVPMRVLDDRVFAGAGHGWSLLLPAWATRRSWSASGAASLDQRPIALRPADGRLSRSCEQRPADHHIS
jgi:hypothetical protein